MQYALNTNMFERSYAVSKWLFDALHIVLILINTCLFVFGRNCLVGASYHIKISDCAMFRPLFKRDYYQSEGEVLPLRWIPWEVQIMVRKFYFKVKF